MNIKDTIYGEFDVEPIFEEIINTKEVQRLKGIHQGGASYLINPKWNVTRYEHSVGTMLFIRLMGGSIEEQIAGLLHDISHTAFSHVIDFALNNSEEDYHEKIYDNLIESSDIPKILLGNGYDYKDILFNESKWTILEKSAPKLCADRIDYTLRDRYHYGDMTKEEIKIFLNNLKIVNGEVVIESTEVSEWFVDNYYKEVIGLFLDPLNVYANNRLAKALSIALELKEITLEDLLKDDQYVYNLLKKSGSNKVIELIESIHKDVKLKENKLNYNIHQKQKVRVIDPTIILDNKLYKTSEKSEVSKLLTEEAIKKSEEEVFIEII